MAELSIQITIANRIYPLRITFEEEEKVRNAVKMIDDKIKEYEEIFSVRDKQDVLAMCALQFATELLSEKSVSLQKENNLKEEITELDNLLSTYISDISEEKPKTVL